MMDDVLDVPGNVESNPLPGKPIVAKYPLTLGVIRVSNRLFVYKILFSWLNFVKS